MYLRALRYPHLTRKTPKDAMYKLEVEIKEFFNKLHKIEKVSTVKDTSYQ